MCLILMAVERHPAYRLVLAANRDEFYDRPSRPLAFWEDAPDVLAGRDLQGRGTWLGVTRQGRIAALTNYRDPGAIIADAPSRGLLVSRFLTGHLSAAAYLQRIESSATRYNGFNLILADADGLLWCSNRAGTSRHLPPGVHGLSNHLLNTPWPKVSRGTTRLEALLRAGGDIRVEALFDLLADRFVPEDAELPDTGIGLEWERVLAPLFIVSAAYGTRSSSVILVDRRNKLSFWERTFACRGGKPVAQQTERFELTLDVKT